MEQQQDAQSFGVVGLLFSLIYLAFIAAYIAGLWKIFVKAGRPGWEAIIPFYNLYILLQVVGRPGWWLALYLFCPPAGLIAHIIVCIDLAKSFGKDMGMGVANIFLVGIPILGFGDAQYQGPSAAGGGVAAA
ncbi:signal peptidase I [Corallococcus aberystwythensis]|uniref:Signal peptidase I n=2 Tax=Corallococcus aberystwythensis TaxID=2316722 RepID=A0A3A8Q2Q3_9BACT|nr:signal peptidase I [Corallococcus aberystwythensis]